MLLFTHSRQAGYTLSITKPKTKKKKYINFRDQQNSAIVADIKSPVMNDIKIIS